MNAFYICCITDPFLEVAKKLKDDCQIEPVYWIGDVQSIHGNDESEIKKVFPNIVYQKFYSAWKGIFSENIEKHAEEMYVDLDFLTRFSSEQIQAISMMDRLDYDRHSFPFMERQRFFISLVKKWLACIDIYHPDVVIGAISPHRVFDYVLYLVCKYKNIKYITFQWSVDIGRIYPVDDFANPNVMSKLLDEDYKSDLLKTIDILELPEDIQLSYKKMSGDYTSARPSYMKKHDINDVQSKKMSFLIRRFLKGHKLFGKNGLIRSGHHNTYYKNANYCMEDSKFSMWEWYLKRKETFKYDAFLSAHYNSLASQPSFDTSYIVFFLHYQPEATTSPNGGIFANQFLCIETLLKNTPDNVMIYVKEHPNQFMSHLQGHTKRIKEFYDDLVRNPRVRFVPMELDSFTLMKNALAVSTVTGTVGWEAAVKKKPVIIFGLVWYERMKGVLRITDEVSAGQIYDFIKGYKYDENAILSYLYTFSRHSILAYHYRGRKESTGYSEEMSVNNICQSLIKILNS